MNDVAIRVKGVAKYFEPSKGQRSFKQVFTSFLKSKEQKQKTKDGYWALKNINFEVKKGEFFGIVGRNGSGKSTMLKMIAGVYTPTKGSIDIDGLLVPFIELGVGFNAELTGRDNVFLNGALLGFDRKEMLEMYDEIVEFAELEDHMDVKLKNFSSGMQVRLAFSIAIRAKSDILLIDEVLAVGDANFQNKCLSIFKEYKRTGKTVIFISHDMAVVRKFCDRVVMIQDGKITDEGTSDEIAEKYENINLPQNQSVDSINAAINKRASKIITKLNLVDIQGKNRVNFKRNELVTLKMQLNKDASARNIGVAIYSNDGSYVFGANTVLDKYTIGEEVSYSFTASLGLGTYSVKIGVFGESDETVLEFFDQGPVFHVLEESPKDRLWQGTTYLKHDWSK